MGSLSLRGPDPGPEPANHHLVELRRRCLEVAALVETAVEMADPISVSPNADRLRALLAVAERSADEMLALVDGLIRDHDSEHHRAEHLAGQLVALDRARRTRRR